MGHSRQFRKRIGGLVPSAVLISGGLIGGVSAQQPAQPTASPASPDTEIQQITVTGSRVVTNGDEAPTPVTVVTSDSTCLCKGPGGQVVIGHRVGHLVTG